MQWHSHIANEQEARSFGGKLFGLWRLYHSALMSCTVPNTFVVSADDDMDNPDVVDIILSHIKSSGSVNSLYAVRSSATGEDGESQS